jgi:EF-P beta-lysylation protein EpmB|tara:strand:+ start:838 stop:1884 length:1047 start_codon:yes stop_codon:yes gene_type:complete
MIQLSTTSVETYTPDSDWKMRLSQSKMTTSELLRYLELDKHPLANTDAEKLFELRVPKAYLDKIKKGDPLDPLLLQILPQNKELLKVEGFTDNPLDEGDYNPVRGLFHKYKNRVLLIASSTCAINCRYCFRRTFPYDEHRQSRLDWQAALDYIQSNKEVDEVIFSGGDPLIQTNQSLLWLLQEVDKIKHIARIRIHTRMLTSLPERLDDQLFEGLNALNTPLVIVTHCNHPNELGNDLRPIFDRLRSANITLLNQSVLLKQVNNNAATLSELSKKLFQLGILPYYLFLLDPVSGSAHFEVSLVDAKTLYRKLQSELPGYLLPRLSVEIAGMPSKTLINIQLSDNETIL